MVEHVFDEVKVVRESCGAAREETFVTESRKQEREYVYRL